MANMNILVDVLAKDSGASGILDAIGKKAEGLGGIVAGAGKAMLGLAAAGAGLAAGGLAASITAAAGFEEKLSEVKAVSGATAAEMSNLSGLALQLGKDTSFSASEAAAGISELVKGGLSIPDIMNGAAQSTLNLAAAGGISLPDAATIAANALAQFNLKGSDMAHVADLIAGAANASALDVSDFKMSLSAAGAVAATVGFSFDDLAQGIAIMGKAGIVGSDAGTSLKTMMLNLQPTTKEQIGLMTQLGIVTEDGGNKFFDAHGKVKSMADVAGVLQTATKGMTEQQKLSTLQTLFGSDAIRAAAVLAKEGAGGFNEMAGAMSKVSAASVGAEKLNNLKGSIDQLKGSLETAGITFGMAFLPLLKSATDAGTSIVNKLIPVLEVMGPKIVGAVQAGGAAISSLLSGDILKAAAIIGQAFNFNALPFLTGLDSVKEKVGAVAQTIKGVFTDLIGGENQDDTQLGLERLLGIDSSATGPIMAVLGSVIDGIHGFVSDVTSQFQQVAGFVKQALGGDVQGALTGFLGMIIDSRVSLVETLLGWGQAFLGWLLPMVPGLLTQLGTFLTSMLTWLGGAIVTTVERLAPLAAAFIDWIGPQIPGLLRELGAFAASMFDWLFAVALPAIREKLGQWGMAFVEWIGPRIGPLLVELGKLLLELGVWLVTVGVPKINEELAKWGAAFTGWIATSVLPFIVAELDKFDAVLRGWLKDRVSDIQREAAKLGDAIVQGVWSGINALGSWLKGKLDGFLSLLPQWARDILGIHSPSTVFAEEVGLPIVQGIMAGIVQGTPLLQQAIVTAIQPPQKVTQGYEYLVQQVKQALVGGYQEWGQVAGGVFRTLSGDAWGLINSTQMLLNLIGKIDFPSFPGGGGSSPINLNGVIGPFPVSGGLSSGAARSLTLARATPRGSGGDTVVVNVQVAGSVTTQTDLITAVHQGLLAKQRRDATLGFL